jgi:hypothetical protein
MTLLKIGFKQVLDFSDQYIYYQKNEKKITIPKLNNIDFFITVKILENIGIDHERFVGLYREAYHERQ